jgi:hypothetical protein
MNAPRFLWNGVKVDGKLYRAWYSKGGLINYPESTITIYGRDYWPHFPQIDGLNVQNDTEFQTDYYETDRVRVTPDNPHYPAVHAAWEKQEAHNAKRYAKRAAAEQ